MASGNVVTKSGGIFIALGANLPSIDYGAPRATLEATLSLLAGEDIAILRRSSWWQSGPQPASGQPDFVNGVIEVDTALLPAALLARMHDIESACGRVRQDRWEARVLDLDLIDYRGRCEIGEAGGPSLPHPRLADRLFVLLPLQEIAPDWRHPITGTDLATLIPMAHPLRINRL
ncbi:MAG: 2-amino-4-hydroxy-6-hydroxymethyldihydropteridine diphosphokinase [Ferrovibrio sp.]|uniref:2-amino-4-hydroxy-6- hydroxymethyldihydropteridine diphosphokinase n=1 Tax=Ferrovibrio sp. TaxID=1917215 RepID=UPI002634E5A8|nr:2-amino-4-hydroxy-6-hydroxymethyldihydropteridine diphosphokinase [Ferrovibrio sp.]MCW0236390.1 2-amino-4-hydroxy-6-hydroxymethyldihydropteridine diphosphokinase [Ferrovibrio sp.]